MPPPRLASRLGRSAPADPDHSASRSAIDASGEGAPGSLATPGDSAESSSVRQALATPEGNRPALRRGSPDANRPALTRRIRMMYCREENIPARLSTAGNKSTVTTVAPSGSDTTRNGMVGIGILR